MTRPFVPDAVLAAAHERSKARRERDWPAADRLKLEIEAAGWKVVDRGADFALEPARPADEQRDGRIVHGTSSNVPSRLIEPAEAAATIVLAPGDRADHDAMVEALGLGAPAGIPIVTCLVDGASATKDAASGDVVWMRAGSSLGARINAGIRRATGAVVIVLTERLEISGDLVGPLVKALADEGTAVAGGWGRASVDLRTFTETRGPASIVDLACIAFRRDDIAAIGLLDEGYHGELHLAAWLSLALRVGPGGIDATESDAVPAGDHLTMPIAGPEVTPRRAVVVELPAERSASAPLADPSDPATRRLDRRDHYRLREAFGDHLVDVLATRP